MKRSHARDQQGFTIIEVLIVLAIAGLILLIVFEAIPTLERNGRNNQRRQDVQYILQAVSHYELSHSANMPAQSDLTNPSFISSSKLTYYTDVTHQITITTNDTYSSGGYTAGTTIPNPQNVDKLAIDNHAKCDTNGDGSATNTGAAYSDVVALYTVETGSGTNAQCQQL